MFDVSRRTLRVRLCEEVPLTALRVLAQAKGYRTLQQVRTLGTASSGMWSNMGGCMLKNCRHTS